MTQPNTEELFSVSLTANFLQLVFWN